MVSMDYTNPRIIKIFKKSLKMVQLSVKNLATKKAVIGQSDVAVSLTSYGPRLKDVWYTIESIAQGDVKPRRLILWVDDPDFTTDDYPHLRRLVNRGLEIKKTENYGPHTKYYPYIQETRGEEFPLVTADDDVVYPKAWLKGLLEAHLESPGVFLGYRAHRFTLLPDRSALAPYAEWQPAYDGEPESYSVFLTGVGGVIYPLELQQKLVDTASSFMEKCPKADDIWINVQAFRNGIKAKKISAVGLVYMSIPGSQKYALHASNVTENQNDAQLGKVISKQDIDILSIDSPVVSKLQK